MKRAALLVVLAIAAACRGGAEPTTLSHPLFWSIAKDGKTTYILGTMHVGVDPTAKLPRSVWARLDAAPVFAMETDPSDPAMATMATRSDGGSLHADLGDAYWKKLETEMSPPVAAQLDHARPMIAAVMLSLKGLPESPAMDGVLLAQAKSAKKELVYLEPARAQLELLDKWMDTRAIKAILDHPTESVEHGKAMLAAYLEGDERRLIALADDERRSAKESGYTDAEFDQEVNELLYARNAAWIDRIEKLHVRGDGFIAVGALHLLGPKSVLDLMAHRGYEVKRLDP